MRRSVVCPEPEEPSSTRNSPSRIERSTPSTAWRSPKCFLKFWISTPATVGALAPGLPPLGRGIRLLRQVHRRGIDDVVKALGHPHLPYRLPRGGRPPPRSGPRLPLAPTRPPRPEGG